MDYLKKQFETIQTNLAGLNATQKMLTVALVAIMGMTMVYWSRYAGTAEMEPVLNQTLSDTDITRMAASLESRGIPNKVEGNKLLVSADRKMQAIAALGFDQLLPHDTTSGFDLMMAKGSTWDSPAQREALMNHGREITLAQVIGMFPNVANAVVMIDPTTIKRFGNDSVSPTATISVTMRSGTSADSKFANAAADLVCGAVAGMNRNKIKVVIDGRARSVRSEGNGDDFGGATEQIDAIAAYERQITSKLENQLHYIDGVVVSVTGTLNTETKEMKSTSNNEKETLVLAKSVDSRSTETNTSNGGNGEAGAVPNIAASVVGAGGSSNTMTDTSDKTINEIIPASTITATKKPAGDYTTLSASVRVPRNYFVAVMKGQNGGKEPTEADLQDFMKLQLADLRAGIRACTNIKKDEDVFVGTYAEPMAVVTATAAAGVTSGGSGGGISGVLNGWGKEVGVGVLAVVSLFMVTTMVKRSTPAPLVIAESAEKGPGTLEAGETVAGFASEGGATLSGMELDEGAMQAQQVLDQVTNLVGENPDGAATLVKRWLNRT